MKKYLFITSLSVIILSLSCYKEKPDPAFDLLKGGVHMMGGEEAFSSLKTIVRKGKVKVYEPDSTHEGDISISIRKEPAGVLISQTFGDEDIVQGYDGRLSWHETFCSEPVATPEYNHFFQLFTLLNAGGLSLGLKETSVLTLWEEEAESSNRGISVELDRAHRFMVYFNADTGLPVKISFKTNINPDEKLMTYSLSYGLFKNIEGLRLPHQWTCFHGAEKIAEIEFSEIVLNNPLDDSLFQIKSFGVEKEITREVHDGPNP